MAEQREKLENLLNKIQARRDRLNLRDNGLTPAPFSPDPSQGLQRESTARFSLAELEQKVPKQEIATLQAKQHTTFAQAISSSLALRPRFNKSEQQQPSDDG